MSSLLENHGREKEVRQIASEWGDWLERNNNWAGAASHFEKVALGGGKAIAFYALSKAGRAYRLAGNREASLTMMRMAQQRAAQEMNASGLRKFVITGGGNGFREMSRCLKRSVVVIEFC